MIDVPYEDADQRIGGHDYEGMSMGDWPDPMAPSDYAELAREIAAVRHPKQVVAANRLAVKCCKCLRTIDTGDTYEIKGSGIGAWDYSHVDCGETSMERHLRGENG